MKALIAATVIGTVLLAGTAGTQAATVTLYDGTGAPASQPWLTLTNIGGTQNVGAGPVNLNTTLNNSIYAGYSNYTVNPFSVPPSVGALKNSSFPTLDPVAGYTLSFAVQIISQANASPNRAGFSVIALSNNLQGIELGFRSSDIFAQNGPPVLFTQGEVAPNPLASTLTTYNLNIQGSTYTLTWGGSNSLTGSLRNYSSFGAPYNTPNFLFLGDDTTSANANINLGAVSLTSGTAPAGVPFGFAPTWGLLAIAGWGGFSYWRRQQRA